MTSDKLSGVTLGCKYQPLHKDIQGVCSIFVLVWTVELHHLSVHVRSQPRWSIAHLVVLQIVDPKGRTANTSPRVMCGRETLAAQDRLATSSFKLLMLYKLAKICANKIVSRADVEFSEQKFLCPMSILYMKDPEKGFAT